MFNKIKEKSGLKDLIFVSYSTIVGEY